MASDYALIINQTSTHTGHRVISQVIGPFPDIDAALAYYRANPEYSDDADVTWVIRPLTTPVGN